MVLFIVVIIVVILVTMVGELVSVGVVMAEQILDKNKDEQLIHPSKAIH